MLLEQGAGACPLANLRSRDRTPASTYTPHTPQPQCEQTRTRAQTCTHTSRAPVCKRLTVAGEVGSGAGQSTVVLTAMGSAINKCITVAEILKRRVAGLHQWNQIQSVMLEVSAPRSPCLLGPIYARNTCCAGGRRTDNWLRGLAETGGQPGGFAHDHHALGRPRRAGADRHHGVSAPHFERPRCRACTRSQAQLCLQRGQRAESAKRAASRSRSV